MFSCRSAAAAAERARLAARPSRRRSRAGIRVIRRDHTSRQRNGRRRKLLICLCWEDFFFPYFVIIRTFCFCAVVCCPLQAAGKRSAQEIDRDPPSSLKQHFVHSQLVGVLFFFRERKPTTEIEP